MVYARTMSRHFATKNSISYARQIAMIAGALALIAMAIASVGCGKNESGSSSGGDVIAVTPMSSCEAGNTYQGNAWNRTPYGQMNAYPYGYGNPNYQPNRQTIASQGFCGCPGGTQPMCDGTYGVVCVQGAMLSNQPNIAWWSRGQNGFGFSGYGGYTDYPGSGGEFNRAYAQPYAPQYQPEHRHDHRYTPGYRQQPVVQVPPNQCATQIGQTCSVGINSCGADSVCRPFGPNQSLGVCSR